MDFDEIDTGIACKVARFRLACIMADRNEKAQLTGRIIDSDGYFFDTQTNENGYQNKRLVSMDTNQHYRGIKMLQHRKRIAKGQTFMDFRNLYYCL